MRAAILFMITVAVCAEGPGTLHAQQPSEIAQESHAQNEAVPAVDDSPSDNTRYSPALNGTGLISLGNSVAKRILVGGDAVSGWDNNPENVAKGASSEVYILSPYVGIEASDARVQFLLQYQPTITHYSSGGGNSQSMQVATATLATDLSQRWRLSFDASGSHGQDAIRLLSPQQTVAVGGVPGIGPGAPSLFANAGLVTFLSGGAGLQYRNSERSFFELGASNTLSRYSGGTTSNNIATNSLSYDYALSPAKDLRVYEQTYYYYGHLNCTSSGGGIGIDWKMSGEASLSLRGGPQITQSACGQQQFYTYSASFSKRLSQNQQAYVLAAREPAISYLGPGLWVVSYSGGYQRQIGLKGAFNVDAGHAGSKATNASSSYSGTYFDLGYKQTFGRGFTTSYTYRHFSGDTGGVGFKRDVTLLSIGWSPTFGHLFQ